MELLGINKVKDGKYLKNYELIYINKAGKEKIYEIVSHSEIQSIEDIGKRVSGVSIVAFHEGKLLLLREFRMGVNSYIYNFCAGFMEENEDIEACIKRELYEETGLKLKRIIKILDPAYVAVSMSDIRNQIAFVEVEGDFEDHTSPDEDIKAAFYTKEQVKDMIKNSEFSARAQVISYFYSEFNLADLLLG